MTVIHLTLVFQRKTGTGGQARGILGFYTDYESASSIYHDRLRKILCKKSAGGNDNEIKAGHDRHQNPSEEL